MNNVEKGLPGSRESVLFLGPALGRHAGWVTTQGEVLAGLFDAAGDRVFVSSNRINPIRRAVDHATELLRNGRHVDVAIVSVFSGKAFALADESINLARAVGIPTVAWLHGGNLPSFAASHPRWARRVLERADAVVAPTRYLARWAEGIIDDVLVIPNVLDIFSYTFRERGTLRPRLLWMRTFHDLYDPTCAVRVLAMLRGQGVEATLTMAGQDKGLLEETKTLAERLGLTEWIRFPGFASAAEKADLFEQHDIFLNTNLVDNAPVTVLEAAASGLIVVSTNVGGIPDLLQDGLSASFVGPSDPEGMALAVSGLLDQPEAAADLARAARRVAEASAWPAVRKRWLSLVGSLSQNDLRRCRADRQAVDQR